MCQHFTFDFAVLSTNVPSHSIFVSCCPSTRPRACSRHAHAAIALCTYSTATSSLPPVKASFVSGAGPVVGHHSIRKFGHPLRHCKSRRRSTRLWPSGRNGKSCVRGKSIYFYLRISCTLLSFQTSSALCSLQTPSTFCLYIVARSSQSYSY
jgi:hypothetical protein